MHRSWAILTPLVLAACSGGADPLPDWARLPSETGPAIESPVEVDLQDGLDLEEAVTLALRQNPRFQASRLETNLARARKVIAQTYPYNPELGIEGGRALPYGRAEDFASRISLSHTVELGGKRGYRIAAAEADIERSGYAVADARRLLRAQVVAQFFEVIFLKQREALAAEKLELARRFLETSAARLRARQIAEIEANVVRLDFNRATTEKEEATRESRIARAKLAALIGRPDLPEFEVKGDLGVIVVIPDRERLARAALEGRPDLHAARAALRVREKNLDLAGSLAVPDVNAGLFAERESLLLDTPTGTLSDRDTVLGVAITIPLPLLNTARGERLEAEIERRRAEFEIEAVNQEIRRDVELAVARLEAARSVVESYEKELNRLAQENVVDIERAYQAGEVGTLEILRAQEDLTRVREAYLDSQLALRLALAEIEAAVGRKLSEVK